MYFSLEMTSTRVVVLNILLYVALHSVRILRDLGRTSLILFPSQALRSFLITWSSKVESIQGNIRGSIRGSRNFCLTCARAQVVLRLMAFAADYDVQPLLRTLIFSTLQTDDSLREKKKGCLIGLSISYITVY